MKRKFQSQEEELQAKKKAILQEARNRRLDFEKLEKQDKAKREGLQTCKEILNHFKRYGECAVFLKIDRTAGWFSMYARQIKNIMDFHTIDTKFDANKYADAHELANDVRLMWDNAMTFNRPNEKIWKDAWKFCRDFERRFKEQVLKIIGKTQEGETYFSVIEQIWHNQHAHYFHEPVDYVKYHMPNYISRVGTPMCLTQVRDRCYSYKKKKDFTKDLNRVFDNARITNAHSSEVHQAAVVLKRKSQEILQKLMGNDDDMEADDGPIAGLDEEPGSSEEEDYTLTQSQMEWLSEHFYELDEDRITPIVEKLSEFSKQDHDEDEPTIDLQELPPKLLYEAYKYVKDSLRVQKQMNQGAGITSSYT